MAPLIPGATVELLAGAEAFLHGRPRSLPSRAVVDDDLQLALYPFIRRRGMEIG